MKKEGIRASSVHRICTNKPEFDVEKHNLLIRDLVEKTKKKAIACDLNNIRPLQEVTGLKTIVKEVLKSLENRKLVESDLLPNGAKTYMKELWLKNNYGFESFSLLEGKPALLKGIYQEDNAIKVLNSKLGTSYVKNTERITKDFLSGECDIKHNNYIRDIKCPETWETFRKKTELETQYYWQGIAYCYLYEASYFKLDYVLMPIPEEKHLEEKFVRNFSPGEKEKFFRMQDKIKSMPPSQRVKTFFIDPANIPEEIEFLKKRITKSLEYYNTLTYEKCMNL